MTTSVKIGEKTKDRLETLQAEIKLETGRKVTQQELLDRIVAREFESKDELIDSFHNGWGGLDGVEIERWLSGTSDWGVETTEAEIDRILYDEEHR